MIPMSFFVKFHTRLQSTGFILVLVLVLDKIPILEDEHEYEDEYEKYQLGSPEKVTRIRRAPLYETTKFLLRLDWPTSRGGAET